MPLDLNRRSFLKGLAVGAAAYKVVTEAATISLPEARTITEPEWEGNVKAESFGPVKGPLFAVDKRGRELPMRQNGNDWVLVAVGESIIVKYVFAKLDIDGLPTIPFRLKTGASLPVELTDGDSLTVQWEGAYLTA